MKDEKRVNLDVGDVMLFRGDLIHSGSAYAKENIRLHAYLHISGIKRPRNTTATKPILYYNGGDGTGCTLHGCSRTGKEGAIKKHVLRDHHVRFKNKNTLGDSITDAGDSARAISPRIPSLPAKPWSNLLCDAVEGTVVATTAQVDSMIPSSNSIEKGKRAKTKLAAVSTANLKKGSQTAKRNSSTEREKSVKRAK